MKAGLKKFNVIEKRKDAILKSIESESHREKNIDHFA